MVIAAFSTTEVVYHIEFSLNKPVTLISVPTVAQKSVPRGSLCPKAFPIPNQLNGDSRDTIVPLVLI